jgi:hypothetical protein
MQNKSSLLHSLRSADASNAASPNANVADVSMTGSQVLKANSSRWMKEHGVARFEWQEGYFACSVSRSQVATIRQYVVNQKDHHFRMISRKSSSCWRKNMDLRLELRRTTKLVVPSPKGDSVSRWFPFPALPCRALDSSVPFGTGLRKGFAVQTKLQLCWKW